MRQHSSASTKVDGERRSSDLSSGGRVWRIGSRGSRLARIQVGEFLDLWKDRVGEAAYELVFFETSGDRDRRTPLMGAVADDFFTDALDEALLERRIDLAVHSAKDVPHRLREGLVVAALTPAWDETDCLVTRPGEALPPHPRIGTSSAARLEALRRFFPDWEPLPIRGNIEDRIRQVDENRYDGAVIATCALKRLGLTERISRIMPWEAVPLQSQLAVVVREDDWPLRLLLRRLDCRRAYGQVVLVGGGCGDPSWLTLRAVRELNRADVVFYDHLIPREILRHLRPPAEAVFVGKRKGAHTMPQEELNRRLRDEARAGRRVVRLKGGDPLIFGRGWEESAYLRAYHIPVSVVPGISAGTGLVSQLGVPLTHRTAASSVGFVTAYGHHPSQPAAGGTATGGEHRSADEIMGTPETETAAVATDPASAPTGEKGPLRLPLTDTLVVFMGLTRIGDVAATLRRQGRPPDWPVMVISRGGTPFETVVTGTIETIASRVVSAGLKQPALIVAGRVVDLAEAILRRPKILYTGWGEPEGDWEWIGRLSPFPLFRIEPSEIPFERLEAVASGRWDVILFTSRHGVESFFGAWRSAYGRGCDAALKRCRFVAVGRVTAKMLESYGIKPDVTARREDSEGLFEAMREAMTIKGARILHPRSDQPNPVLKILLERNGASVEELTAYQNIMIRYDERPNDPSIRGVFFTSPSTVGYWHEQFGTVPESWWIFARGERTQEALVAHGYTAQRIVVLQRLED